MAPEELAKGLNAHWENGVNLPKGSVIQRLSTVKETEIRPKGFFGAFDQNDVERYKAELPKWWKTWGYDNTDGYLTQIKSVKEVRAPSGKESIRLYKNILEKDNTLEQLFGADAVKLLSPERKSAILEGMAKKHFADFSVNWANGYDGQVMVQSYFQEVKSAGYNALIDFNDSGKLAKTPLRLLDGSDFKIAGHVHVSQSEIKSAQQKLTELVMSMLYSIDAFLSHKGGTDMTTVDEFLEHHGVKGMRWGVRTGSPGRMSKKQARDHKKITSVQNDSKVTHPSKLSDEELRKAINRMEMEQKYLNLSDPKKTKTKSAGAEFAKELGKNALKTAANAAVQHQVNNILRKSAK